MHQGLVLLLTLSVTTLAYSLSPSLDGNYQQQNYLHHHAPQQQFVPSANIFTPPWLAQRRSRHLASTGSVSSSNIYALYPSPEMYNSPFQPRTYLQPAHTSYSREPSPPMYQFLQQQHQQQPYYQQTYETMPYAHQGPVTAYYPHSPQSSTVYLVGGDQQFAKRVDSQTNFLKPAGKPKTPCSSSSLPSEHYPVYVLPPKNFQPIIYHHQQAHPLTSTSYHHSPAVITKSAEEFWYEKAGNGEKIKYGSGKHHENALEQSKPLSSNDYRKIYLVPVSSDQVGTVGASFPVYEAVIREVVSPVDSGNSKNVPTVSTNAFNSQIEVRPAPEPSKADQRRLKTKLPVGLTSFFLGGIRGVSGRHWAMPPELVKNLEFMPNLSPMSPENKYLPEESYVKKVDNGGEPAAAGDPEKEDTPSIKPAGGKKAFEGANTIIDSPLDLETAESSPSLPSLPPAPSTHILAKS